MSIPITSFSGPDQGPCAKGGIAVSVLWRRVMLRDEGNAYRQRPSVLREAAQLLGHVRRQGIGTNWQSTKTGNNLDMSSRVRITVRRQLSKLNTEREV